MLLEFPLEFKYTTQLAKIIKGIYNISTGGVTQKNISRQSNSEGLSYRSVQRFFSRDINWSVLYLSIISYFFAGKLDEVYLLALDEVVESKSGKCTHKIGYFFSSIANRPIRSVCFHVCSLISVSSGKSFVLQMEQQEQGKKKEQKDSKKPPAKPMTKSGQACKKAGRPKGSKDKTKTKAYTALSKSFETLLKLSLPLLLGIGLAPSYVVADGSYSSKTFLLICSDLDLDLISKLTYTTALYLPAPPKEKGKKGRPPKYGKRIRAEKLNEKSEYYIKTIPAEQGDSISVQVYQIPKVWTTKHPQLLNVVVLIGTNVNTGKTATTLLFSTDLSLSAELIIQYYSLRFQIEFNFRDAKQYFGLADFRAYKQRQVQNSVGLAFFMVNFSHLIRKIMMDKWQLEQFSILDLKACFRTEKSIERVFNYLNFDLEEFKINNDYEQMIRQIAAVEAVNLE